MSDHLPVSHVSFLEFSLCSLPSPLVCRLILRLCGLEDQRPTVKGSPLGTRAYGGDEGLFAPALSEISASLSGSSWSP